MTTIPKDVSLHIFSFLKAPDLGKLARVSKSVKTLAEDDRVWRNFLDVTPPEGMSAKAFYQHYLEVLDNARGNLVHRLRTNVLTTADINGQLQNLCATDLKLKTYVYAADQSRMFTWIRDVNDTVSRSNGFTVSTSVAEANIAILYADDSERLESICELMLRIKPNLCLCVITDNRYIKNVSEINSNIICFDRIRRDELQDVLINYLPALEGKLRPLMALGKSLQPQPTAPRLK